MTQNTINKLAQIAAWILALFFIASGIGKLLDVSAFRGTLAGYGFSHDWTAIGIPVPPLEIVLGLLLFFAPGNKSLTRVSAATLAVFTLGFLYGHFGKGIEDCGCFGKLKILETPAWVSLLRNGILLLLTFFMWHNGSTKNEPTLKKWHWITLAVVACFTFMLAGSSSIEPLYQPSNPMLNKKVEETPLAGLATFAPEKTYLVFAFSSSCGVCWDATANVKGYLDFGIVDEIIGFTYGEDIALMDFQDRFEPNFESTILSSEQFDKLASRTPTTFLVRKGVVENVQVGEVMAAQRFFEDAFSEIN